MTVEVRKIKGKEYYLEHGILTHYCKVIPPKHGEVICDTCGITVVDDFDYSDELREDEDGC